MNDLSILTCWPFGIKFGRYFARAWLAKGEEQCEDTDADEDDRCCDQQLQRIGFRKLKYSDYEICRGHVKVCRASMVDALSPRSWI